VQVANGGYLRPTFQERITEVKPPFSTFKTIHLELATGNWQLAITGHSSPTFQSE